MVPASDKNTTPPAAFWSEPAAEIIRRLRTAEVGLTSAESSARLQLVGPNRLAEEGRGTVALLLWQQFRSPLVFILVFGAVVALALQEWVNAALILFIIGASATLGFLQEYRSSRAVAALRQRLALKSRVLRDEKECWVPTTGIVPGDVILLAAGSMVPADALILEARDFLVTEASLTGESLPVEKQAGIVPATTRIGRRTNTIFMGCSVQSGTARAVVVETGQRTEFGSIARRLETREPATEFTRGLAQFGRLLVGTMAATVAFVLTINQLVGRPVADSLLFAVALAVGLSPELLPAIVTVTLSRGAKRLAQNGVIVRRLETIENLGGMDVLCADKTGTLTMGSMVLEACVDPAGRPSANVAKLAFINASLETGIVNPLDQAIVAMGKSERLSLAGIRKVDEIPYDFVRRRLTVVVDEGVEGDYRIVAKGAFANVLEACEMVRDESLSSPLDARRRDELEAYFQARGEEGYRVLAVAERQVPAQPRYGREDEEHLIFTGFLLFVDPPKPDAAKTIRDLAALGVALKVISGDNRYGDRPSCTNNRPRPVRHGYG